MNVLDLSLGWTQANFLFYRNFFIISLVLSLVLSSPLCDACLHFASGVWRVDLRVFQIQTPWNRRTSWRERSAWELERGEEGGGRDAPLASLSQEKRWHNQTWSYSWQPRAEICFILKIWFRLLLKWCCDCVTDRMNLPVPQNDDEDTHSDDTNSNSTSKWVFWFSCIWWCPPLFFPSLWQFKNVELLVSFIFRT